MGRWWDGGVWDGGVGSFRLIGTVGSVPFVSYVSGTGDPKN